MARSQLIDLYSDMEPLGIVPLGRPRRLEDMMDEEEKDSLLRSLAQTGASGLSAVGWLLDTPGAILRGALAGGPMKGLSALWETSDDRITGRELLREYGLAGKEDNWGNFSSGLAAEILLDPLTYASLGANQLLGRAAKTAAGKAARRAGMLDTDLGLLARRVSEQTGQQIGRNQLLRKTPAELADLLPNRAEALEEFRRVAGDQADTLLGQRMTATNRLSIPMVGEWGADLFGQRAGDYLAKAADRLGDSLQYGKYTGPAVRTMQSLVDPTLMGFTDEEGRWFARELSQATKDSARSASGDLSRAMTDAFRNVGDELFRSEDFARAFGNAMEGQWDQVPANLRPLFESGGGAFDLLQAAKRWQRDALDQAAARGIPLKKEDLPNGIDYFFRQSVKLAKPTFDPRYAEKARRAYDASSRVASVVGGEAGRRGYTRALPAWVINKMARDGDLQEALRAAQNLAEDGDDAVKIIDNWLDTNLPADSPFRRPFDYRMEGDAADFQPDLFDKGSDKAAKQRTNDYIGLADMLRQLPLEFSRKQIDYYQNPLNSLQQYTRSRARNEATADVLLRKLQQNVVEQAADSVPGGTNYGIEEALSKLGFDTDPVILKGGTQGPSNASQALASQLGLTDPAMLDDMSIDKKLVDQLSTRIMKSRVPNEVGPLLNLADAFTQRFKTLALLYPSRYTRDQYSGAFAAATEDAFSLGDAFAGMRIGGGSYKQIPGKVRKLPQYQDLKTPANLNRLRAVKRVDAEGNVFRPFEGLTDDQLHDELMIRKFLSDAGQESLTGTSVVDDLGRSGATLRDAAPGMSGPYFGGLLQQMRERPIPWDLYQQRGGGFTNWLLSLGDRTAEASDSFNRIGSYLNRIRKGDSPRAAKALADLTQVNYRPEAFTEFEREFVKRLVPFYSYTKGITPLVAKQLLERPAGLMGQSIRAVNRAGEPNEDTFTPEYLRQSASIPIDPGFPLLGLDTPGITRFLTNIDLPHESLLNLFTPGVGNNPVTRAGNAVMKTAQNVLGQTNPLLKGPLEYALNRQFYSGRQLSDLYSMLESDIGSIGRPLEQVLVNTPGGSRLLGIIRQLRDDRISGGERAAKFLFNALTGLKVQDVDAERTRRLAARSTLNTLLDQAPNMASYENLYIKPEDLVNLSEQEKRQYLLYRILQSEASRQARERKKAQQDPLSILGLTPPAMAGR